ncbi:MAG: hypothetical protein OEU26_21795 [Candidatus Tectomicrobia bacterium]|nr:hypothetical protein [Candidatus Tectomicrobia bacterium]
MGGETRVFLFCSDTLGLDALRPHRIILRVWKTTPDDSGGTTGARAASWVRHGLLPRGCPFGMTPP